jgi:hypothetical protein
MTHATILLSQLLKCGYADITFFEKELDDFKVEIDDLDIDNLEEQTGETPTLNTLLYELYRIVCERHGIEEDRYSIFVNCMDSHLSIDGDEMYTDADVSEKKIEEVEED